MKGDFDYKRAWKELAEPEFKKLPDVVHKLYHNIHDHYSHCQQDRDCDLPWPDDRIKTVFDSIDLSVLARASRVIYFYGHWGSGLENNGAYWRFSLWADQTIRRKLALDESSVTGVFRAARYNISLAIREGYLRVCRSTKASWTWEEIGPVSEDLFDDAVDLLSGNKYSNANKAYEAVLDLRKTDDKFLDLDEYKERSEDEQEIIDALKGTNFKFVEITNANFDPHPFMITGKHLANSKSMYLNPDCAPCGFKGCQLSYAEHTSERVAVFKLRETVETKLSDLEVLKPILEKHHIVGVAVDMPNSNERNNLD